MGAPAVSGLAIEDITPRALSERLAAGDRPVLADVPDRLDELDREHEIVVLCHHGRRSRQVVAFLKQCGFPRVLNLAGGIDAWSAEVDPGVPVY